ncbi:MAG: hypothetical protein LLF76_09145 [Planctomycetaceae bacterium]|nr:hypothetical protein [Planctomycetaceae bacterium]
MDFTNRKQGHFAWHYLFLLLMVLTLVFFIAAEVSFKMDKGSIGNGLEIGFSIFLWAGVLLAVYAALILLYKTALQLRLNSEKMENTVEMLSRQNNLLAQISQAARLSDTAKEIVFHDTEQIELGEAVLNKLHQHDFDTSIAMVNEMAQEPKYKELAARLRLTTEKYRSATEEGRINQVIAHIENLFDQKLWAQAAAHTENLIKTFPHSDKAKTMPTRLRERKDRQKRELLAAWDLAVRDKNTDRSLEILKELDLYLTPTEAMALRESASSVFRTKLHNLGVVFSVAVTEQNWQKAYETGRQIVQDFPNSRMAAEIRSRMDILSERAKQKKPA